MVIQCAATVKFWGSFIGSVTPTTTYECVHSPRKYLFISYCSVLLSVAMITTMTKSNTRGRGLISVYRSQYSMKGIQGRNSRHAKGTRNCSRGSEGSRLTFHGLVSYITQECQPRNSTTYSGLGL